MAEKYMKKYSITSLQGNARQRHKKYHLFPVRIMMIIIKEKNHQKITKHGKDVEMGGTLGFIFHVQKGNLWVEM